MPQVLAWRTASGLQQRSRRRPSNGDTRLGVKTRYLTSTRAQGTGLRGCTHFVFCKELWQILLAGLHQNSEITSINDLNVQFAPFFDQESELRVQLWCATCQVQCLDAWGHSEQLQTPLGSSTIHHLLPFWRGLNVAMCARLIAVQADIQL